MKLHVKHSMLLLLIGYNIYAQNLVPNPSFEIYSTCPNSYGQIAYAIPWDVPPNSTSSSPEYFNSCHTTDYFSVPMNVRGNQSAFDGGAYVGIATYFASNYREYIQTQLTSPLAAGQIYYVNFYVSCADRFKYASNNMGAVFTEQPLNGNGSQPINITPHILNTNVIIDTSGWTLVSGTYQAIGNEQYITIGNFFNDASTQVTVINTIGENFGFYYVDNVYVSTSPLQNDEFITNRVSIVPNPIKNQFTIVSTQNESIMNIELYSQYNKVRALNIGDKFFDITDLPTGIYYLIITFESNRKAITKIIKS